MNQEDTPDPERIRDQLRIEQRLRALEDAVGVVGRPPAPKKERQPSQTLLSRLEALEAQLEMMHRSTRDGD